MISCQRSARQTNSTANALIAPDQYSQHGSLFVPVSILHGAPLINYGGQVYRVDTVNSSAVVKDFLNALSSNPYIITPTQSNSTGFFYNVSFSGAMAQALCPDPNQICNTANLTSLKGR